MELQPGDYEIGKGASCPSCRHTLPLACGIDHEDEPKPGDLTLCIRCAAYLQFDDDLQLEIFPEVELLDLPDDTRLLLVRGRQAIKTVHQIEEEP